MTANRAVGATKIFCAIKPAVEVGGVALFRYRAFAVTIDHSGGDEPADRLGQNQCAAAERVDL